MGDIVSVQVTDGTSAVLGELTHAVSDTLAHEKEARDRATALGYDLGEFVDNGDVMVATCRKSLAKALVFKDGRIEGEAVTYPFPVGCADKSVEITHEEMSSEFRTRINRPWRPPSMG